MILDEFVEVKKHANNAKRFENFGYTATDKGYFKVKPEHLSIHDKTTKIKIKCDTCGREYVSTWHAFSKKQDKTICIYCCPFATKTYDFIFNEFAKRDYDLLTDHYINAHQHLEYRCRKHPEHVQKIIYNSLQRGSGCAYCAREARRLKKRLTEERAIQLVQGVGYKFIGFVEDGKILNSKTYIKYICPKHPKYVQKVTFNRLQQGNRCPMCYAERKRYNFNPDKPTTPIREYFRPHMIEWKELSEKLCNGVCILTGSTKYAIHHHKPFEHILREALINVKLPRKERAGDYSIKEIEVIIAELKRLHVTYGPGVCLADYLHKKLHSTYGSKEEITKEQFEQFCRDFREGKIYEINPEYGKEGFNDLSKSSAKSQAVGAV